MPQTLLHIQTRPNSRPETEMKQLRLQGKFACIEPTHNQPLATPNRRLTLRGKDVAEFANIAHVNATHIWIKRESPAQGSVCLLLRSKSAHKVLVEERRDNEGM